MTIVTAGNEAKTGSVRAKLVNRIKMEGPISLATFFAPVAVLVFLGLFRAVNLQSPQILGSTVSLPVIGIVVTAGSAAGLFLTVKAPSFLHRAGKPAILMLIAPFLKTGMWESEELAGVMRRSWELMTQHIGFIQQLPLAQKYSVKPSNFTMVEAISLILKLLPLVEKHSATCARCK